MNHFILFVRIKYIKKDNSMSFSRKVGHVLQVSPYMYMYMDSLSVSYCIVQEFYLRYMNTLYLNNSRK